MIGIYDLICSICVQVVEYLSYIIYLFNNNNNKFYFVKNYILHIYTIKKYSSLKI